MAVLILAIILTVLGQVTPRSQNGLTDVFSVLGVLGVLLAIVTFVLAAVFLVTSRLIRAGKPIEQPLHSTHHVQRLSLTSANILQQFRASRSIPRGAHILLDRNIESAQLVECLDPPAPATTRQIRGIDMGMAVARRRLFSTLTIALAVAELALRLPLALGRHQAVNHTLVNSLTLGAAVVWIALVVVIRMLNRKVYWMLQLTEGRVTIHRLWGSSECRTVSMNECVVLQPIPAPRKQFKTPEANALCFLLLLPHEPNALYVQSADIRGTLWERWIREFAEEEERLLRTEHDQYLIADLSPS